MCASIIQVRSVQRLIFELDVLGSTTIGLGKLADSKASTLNYTFFSNFSPLSKRLIIKHTLMWPFNWEFWLNLAPHSLHPNVFSLIPCVIMWSRIWPLKTNRLDLLRKNMWKVINWNYRFFLPLKFFSQIWHWIISTRFKNLKRMLLWN